MIENKLASLHKLFDNYCLGGLSAVHHTAEETISVPIIVGGCSSIIEPLEVHTNKFLGNCEKSNISITHTPKATLLTEAAQKKCKGDVFVLERKIKGLMRTLESISDPNLKIITKKQKTAPRIRNNIISSRRSQYIGVFRNGHNWQALITINKHKMYLGNFESQLVAAQTFDLYSILLNGLTASTNFDYKCDEMIQIIEKFKLYGESQ